MGVVAEMAGRIIVLKTGDVVEDGPTSRVLAEAPHQPSCTRSRPRHWTRCARWGTASRSRSTCTVSEPGPAATGECGSWWKRCASTDYAERLLIAVESTSALDYTRRLLVAVSVPDPAVGQQRHSVIKEPTLVS